MAHMGGKEKCMMGSCGRTKRKGTPHEVKAQIRNNIKMDCKGI